MAKEKKKQSRTDSIKCWQGHGPALLTLCWGDAKWYSYFPKTAGQLFRKLNICLAYDPIISLLGSYPRT